MGFPLLYPSLLPSGCNAYNTPSGSFCTGCPHWLELVPKTSHKKRCTRRSYQLLFSTCLDEKGKICKILHIQCIWIQIKLFRRVLCMFFMWQFWYLLQFVRTPCTWRSLQYIDEALNVGSPYCLLVLPVGCPQTNHHLDFLCCLLGLYIQGVP